MERSKEVSTPTSQFSFNSGIKLQLQALKSLAYPQGFICCYCFILALFLIHSQVLGTRPLPFFNPLLLGKEIRRQEENSSLFYLSLSFVQVLGATRPGVWQVSTQDTSDTQGLLTVQWNVYLIFFPLDLKYIVALGLYHLSGPQCLYDKSHWTQLKKHRQWYQGRVHGVLLCVASAGARSFLPLWVASLACTVKFCAGVLGDRRRVMHSLPW